MNRRSMFALVHTIAHCLVSAAALAENWPMWRGSSNDGVSAETDVPLHWSETENIAWKTAIPGVGHSSPICWEDSVFVTSADTNSNERLLFHIDRATGDIRWRRTVTVAEIEQMHRSNSPASGTPATDGRFVYTAFQKNSELLVSAHDFDGHLVWRQTPGEFESRHGFNTSPVIHDGSLFLSGMQDGPDAFFARLDCFTGQIVWKSAIEDPVRSFSTPFVVRSQSRAQIVLSGANRTLSFDPRNGSRLWSARGPAQKTVSSICRGDGMLFVAGGRDNTLLAIRPDGSGDVTESHVAWRASRGIPYVCSPVFHDGILHVISDDGIYTRYAANDGSIQMRHRLTSAVSSSPVVACRRIYITDEDGRTKVVDAGSEFRVLANNSVGERTFASLAVSGGDILIRGECHLFCVRQSPATARTE